MSYHPHFMDDVEQIRYLQKIIKLLSGRMKISIHGWNQGSFQYFIWPSVLERFSPPNCSSNNMGIIHYNFPQES